MTAAVLTIAPPAPWCHLCRGRHPSIKHARVPLRFAPEDLPKVDALLSRQGADPVRALARIKALARRRIWSN